MNASGRTVMVVDDEPDVLDMLDLLFTSEGYRVLKAPGGREAMALLEREHPDLMLLDIMMPDVDGHMVCEFVRSRSALKRLPVFMLTAKNEVSHIARALDGGADGFVVKPFDTEDLLHLVGSRVNGETHAFYKSGRALVPFDLETARSETGRIVYLTLMEGCRDFSCVVDACEGEHYNLLSLWQREMRDEVATTALLNVSSSEHFGTLLNRIFQCECGARILHCTVYETLDEIPVHLMQG